MTEWLETYRGVVNAWECDVVEHFTIAYYFDRFADASRNFFDLIGEGEHLGFGSGASSARLHVTFQNELRAGAAHHILSGITAIDSGSLRVGHQVIESATGKTVTWLSECLPLPAAMPSTTRQKLQALTVEWPGPKVPDRPVSERARGPLMARDRVKPWEIGESGTLSLPDHVHRFSAGILQALSAIGMTSSYMQKHRRGFSTFELDLRLSAGAKVGNIVDVRTTIDHLGNTSLRFLHRMTDSNGRELASMLQAGVHLDLDARRSTAIPKELRDLASKLLG